MQFIQPHFGAKIHVFKSSESLMMVLFCLIYLHNRWFKRIKLKPTLFWADAKGFWDLRDFETDWILGDGILSDGILRSTGFWDRRDFIWRDFETDGILFDGILRPTGFCLTGLWARDFEPTGFRATGFWDRAFSWTRVIDERFSQQLFLTKKM